MKKVKLELLRKQREDKDWTQEMLSSFSGLSVRTIQRIEKGERATLESAKSLSAALGLTGYIELQTTSKEKKVPTCKRKEKPVNVSFGVRVGDVSMQTKKTHQDAEDEKQQERTRSVAGEDTFKAIAGLVILSIIILWASTRPVMVDAFFDLLITISIGFSFFCLFVLMSFFAKKRGEKGKFPVFLVKIFSHFVFLSMLIHFALGLGNEISRAAEEQRSSEGLVVEKFPSKEHEEKEFDDKW